MVRLNYRLEHIALAATLLFVGGTAAAQPPSDEPIPIVRGHRLSGAVRYQAKRPPGGGGGQTVPSCSTPGSTNYKTNCHGTGRPVNETWIATNGSKLVAGANDYNSYNGQGQNGYYWSTDGSTWKDAGPIDVFPHNPNYGAGDPGLAIDSNNVVYYSSLFFSFSSCKIGGVELLRGVPNNNGSWNWSYYQIAANSNKQFQDKPTIAIDNSHVYVSWTQFGSCSGINVPSPIRVAVFQPGATSVAPSATFTPPGSTYSQGSSIAADGNGGFWIAWEEYPSASASVGAIMLSHCTGTTANSCDSPQTISPLNFQDLPSPLPGFAFRTDSFPALTLSGGSPQVVWTSYDNTAQPGRVYLWSESVGVVKIADLGDDQFFPAVAPRGNGGVFVSFSQTDRVNGTYDQYLWEWDGNANHLTTDGTNVTKISTASSVPDSDAFFSGEFIGDYNGMAVLSGAPHPTWTDIRGSNPNYPGYEMDAMTYSQ